MCMRCLATHSPLAADRRRGVAAAALHTGVARRESTPQDMVPLVGPGFKPTDRDEQGLWKEMERAEEEVAGSNLLINDPRLTGYLKNLIGTVGGPAAQDFRIYLMRIPDFNAMMFPTGFAVVFSGLLLRMRNEAQLAGVIAHESGHFLRRHMIRIVARPAAQDRHFRDRIDARRASAARGRASISAIMSSWPSSAPSCRCSSYSREMEAEADAIGARLIADAGYPPIEMSNIWQQLIGEEQASARYRRKHRRRGRPVRHPPLVGRAHGRPSRRRRRSDGAGQGLRRSTASAICDDRRRSGRCCSTIRSSSTTPAPASI